MTFDPIQAASDLRKGSYKAFTQIYHAYADDLYAFAIRYLKNRQAAQDIVQDTFMRLWGNRSQIDCFGDLRGFIFAIAKHRIIDTFRRQLLAPQFSEYMEYCNACADELSPEDVLLYDEFITQLKRSKSLLTPRQRQIFEMSREQGLTPSDIASELGLSEQTVKNTLVAALRTLRDELRKYRYLFIFFV